MGVSTRITLPVEGMTCASCQATVQRALRATPGVAQAAVNLMTHEATIVYDPAVLGPERLVAAINDIGYESRLPPPVVKLASEDDERESLQRREYHILRRKAATSLVIGALAMIASMPLMGGASAHVAHGGDPLLRWVMTVVDPPIRRALPWLYAVNSGVLAFALLAATLFVMGWAGRHF